jgi:hypothetical protein
VGTTPRSKPQILRSLKDFLEEESSHPKAQQCRHCGSPMQFVGAHFQLSGTNLHRDLSLPVCPVCECEFLQNLPRPETIH